MEEKEGGGGTDKTNPGVDINSAVDLDMDLDIKDEEGTENVSGTGETAATAANRDASPRKTKVVPHYHIISKIHTPQAFKTFVDWLHNIKPDAPEDREECKYLLQAYVLAVNYAARALQNAIMDCFRAYHTEVAVELDHLVWMVNNTGDNTNLAMTAYLVQQIAFEIAAHGIEKYEKNNQFMTYYMREGNRVVRYELVKAIARRATAAGRKDGNPATSDPDRWYVAE